MLMGSDQSQQPLLSASREHCHLNEKSELQRRRLQYDSASETQINHQEQNDVQNPLHPQCIAAKSDFNFKQVFLLFAAYLGGGTLCFFFTEYQIKGIKTNGFLDSVYFCVVTMTTVGYGDLVPNSSLAKLLACIYVFIGMALGGLILSKAADYIVEKQENLLVGAIHMGYKVGHGEVPKVLEANKTKYKLMLAAATLVGLMIVGIIFLYFVENLEFMDALYFVCSTVTTLGYGDKSFSTAEGRIFAIFWILSGTICLAQFFLYLAELYTEGRQKSLAKMVLSRRLSLSDLETADLDQDKVVSAAEFIVYKLKEMGKISEEDIAVVMESFRKLDYDNSGTLTEADIRFCESS
ncbi:Two pore domain potassium channel [Sesbania bispinosa]|nr:Two pore domain potassium channel [Sesbania bispinosa]